MEAAAMVVKFKSQIVLSVATCLLILSLIYIAPSLIALFSPLLISTAVFTVTVYVFSHTSSVASNSTEIKAGEGLLDYVASATEEFERYKSQHPEVDDSHQSE